MSSSTNWKINIIPTNSTTTTNSTNWILTSPNYNWFTVNYSVARVKHKWRKTLVREQKWIKLDDWYMGKIDTKAHKDDLASIKSYLWAAVLAHDCGNGSIRAPMGFKIWTRKRKPGLGIVGKCSGCAADINDKVKYMIHMLELM